MESVEGKKNPSGSGFAHIVMPKNAVASIRGKSTLFIIPETILAGGYTYFIPNEFVRRIDDRNEITVDIPYDYRFKAHSNRMNSDFIFGVPYLENAVADSLPEEYSISSVVSDDIRRRDSSWRYITIPFEARIGSYETYDYFKIPSSSSYSGCVYYLSKRLVREDEGGLRISLPSEYKVRLSRKSGKGEEESFYIDRDAYFDEVKGKGKDEYTFIRRNNLFETTESNLKNIPQLLRDKNNWVALKVVTDSSGRRRKMLFNPKSPKSEFAKSDDSSTWGSFEEAVRYARRHGCQGLAYALDGDGLSCIDIDHCIETDISQEASEILGKSNGTYVEKSISGNGLHIFFRAEDFGKRSFSKNGHLELYQKEHFMGVTGDIVGDSNEILTVEETGLKEIIEELFEKKAEYINTGRGMLSLSSLSDREIIEKAGSSRIGDKFTRLYAGEDLCGNRSNSDMALMNLLAFWCGGDREQMLRIFSSSGLYRPEKSQNYYEHTATKAVCNVTERYGTRPICKSAERKTENRK